MHKRDLKIGLALSGGGVRATAFHLGVLKRLAEINMLEKITYLSTVSGGTLAVGLIYSQNNNVWPSSEEYLNKVLPAIKNILTKKDLQIRAIARLVLNPWYLNDKANALAVTIRKSWGITGSVSSLLDSPRWIINATTYETGKNWRFTPKRMGDYICGYTHNPNIPLSVAMAASAGFPFLIGPYALKTKAFKWVEGAAMSVETTPMFKKVHLWDGGIYENLGTEALFKLSEEIKLREGINYLLISDASGALNIEKRNIIFAHKKLKRLISVATDQIRSLRARQIMRYLTRNPGKGLYIKIGNSAKYITGQARMETEEAKKYINNCMNDSDVQYVKGYKTTLRKLSASDFDKIVQHGYEVLLCTQGSYETIKTQQPV